jgi:hypothetical protein
MSKWVKDLVALAIGIGITTILLAFAWQFFGGSAGSVKLTKTEFEVKVDPRLPTPAPDAPKIDKAAPPASISAKACRLPEHGIERWGKTQAWTADSDWRKGGSSPSEFCAAQKIERERQFPDRTIALLKAFENHKSEYTPFKHDFYRYICAFEDRWDPIYKLAENSKCGTG